VSQRSRIFFGLLIIYAAGMAYLLYSLTTDLDPRYRESAEESLVETSHLMAALVEQDVRDGVIDAQRMTTLLPAPI
jgi:two-component system, OmpR family, sensor histidine kinase CreC